MEKMAMENLIESAMEELKLKAVGAEPVGEEKVDIIPKRVLLEKAEMDILAMETDIYIQLAEAAAGMAAVAEAVITQKKKEQQEEQEVVLDMY